MKKYILLIVVVIIGLAFWFVSDRNNDAKNLQVLAAEAAAYCKDVKLATHGQDKASCLAVDFPRQQNLTNPAYCNVVDLTPELGDRSTKDDKKVFCANEIARNARDARLCVGAASSISVQRNNYNSCLFAVAVSGTEPSACSTLPSVKDKDDCYRTYASSLKDIRICEKSSDPLAKSWCYYRYNGEAGPRDVNLCSQMIEPVRSQCYLEIAANTRNAQLCTNIDPSVTVEGRYGFDGTRKIADLCRIMSDPKFGVQ